MSNDVRRAMMDFSNVFVYVADALRFDSVPESLRGTTTPIKTIAAGTASPSAFASIVTGRYPPQHGVYGFDNALASEVPTLFDLFPDHSTSYFPAEGQIPKILGVETVGTSIDDIDEPFVLLERDLFTHAPYGLRLDQSEFGSTNDYFASVRGDRERITSDYKKGAERTAQKFQSRIDSLETRGLLDDTFIIFTADHGELLGIRGLVGHGSPLCPELITVPTIFWNPTIEISHPVISQVDLVPTIASALGKDLDSCNYPGIDLIRDTSEQRLLFNQSKRKHRGECGIWDANGGYVFSQDSYRDRMRWYLQQLLRIQTSPYSRRNALDLLKTSIEGIRSGSLVYGDPGFERADAIREIDSVKNDRVDTRTREIGESERERLANLGYVEHLPEADDEQ